MRFHVAPASSDRKTPPSAASISAYTRFGSAAETETPIFPQIAGGRPGFLDRSVHVLPPSVVLNSPLPGPPLDIEWGVRNTSQNPAYSTSGLLASIVRSTAPAFSLRNSTLFHVLPPSVV